MDKCASIRNLVAFSKAADKHNLPELSSKLLRLAEDVNAGCSDEDKRWGELAKEIKEAGLWDWMTRDPATKQREKAQKQQKGLERQKNKEYAQWFQQWPKELANINNQLTRLQELSQYFEGLEQTVPQMVQQLQQNIEEMNLGLIQAKQLFESGQQWWSQGDPYGLEESGITGTPEGTQQPAGAPEAPAASLTSNQVEQHQGGMSEQEIIAFQNAYNSLSSSAKSLADYAWKLDNNQLAQMANALNDAARIPAQQRQQQAQDQVQKYLRHPIQRAVWQHLQNMSDADIQKLAQVLQSIPARHQQVGL